MKSKPLLCTLLLLTVLHCTVFAAQEELQVGAPAPQIDLPDLQGKEFELQNLSGECKAVVVLFWGVWCPYCRELMVRLNSIYDRLQREHVEVVAVSMRESPHKVALFTNMLKPDFPILVDEWAKLQTPYKIRDVPRVVVMDRNLVVLDTRITTSTQTMEEMIESALQDKVSQRDSSNNTTANKQ